MAARPCTPGCFALQSCPDAALFNPLLSPAATPVPASSRQHVASGLRLGLLQQSPTGSKEATTLPTSTTATIQKYPVEASPIPSSDDVVLGETSGMCSSWEGASCPHGEGWAGGSMLLCSRIPLCPLHPSGLIVVCTLAGLSALVVAGVCWCR